MLIKTGKYDVDWQEPNIGVSILHCVIYTDEIAAVNVLVGGGAKVNIVNRNQETPLHWAAKMNSVKSARYIIQCGADVNALDNSGTHDKGIIISHGNY